MVVTGQDCQCYNVWNQVYSREMLEEELKEAGFPKPDFMMMRQEKNTPAKKIRYVLWVENSSRRMKKQKIWKRAKGGTVCWGDIK